MRLGFDGPEKVKSHPWFSQFNWEALHSKTLTPLFVPDVTADNFNKRFINQVEH